MNNNKKIRLMQGALRAGVCLFMLSGSCVLYAQDAVTEEPAAKTAPAKKAAAPKYEMKEVSGFVYDGATKKPLAGVKVQALNNKMYSALTDDNGKYTIRVPKFVDVLFVALQDYNPTQLAIKSNDDQNVYLVSGMNSDFIYDGATKKPLAGVKVQALHNKMYSALTDANG